MTNEEESEFSAMPQALKPINHNRIVCRLSKLTASPPPSKSKHPLLKSPNP